VDPVSDTKDLKMTAEINQQTKIPIYRQPVSRAWLSGLVPFFFIFFLERSEMSFLSRLVSLTPVLKAVLK